MRYLLDLLYLFVAVILSPWLIYKSITTGKYRRGLWSKITGSTPSVPQSKPIVWFHGVSVGEIHLLGPVVASFQRRHPDWNCVISTTTDTGYEEARKRFPDWPVFYWPLDFSWSVGRALRAINPACVVLAEGELWPNFLLSAKRREIPVCMINGRLSPRSFRRYSSIRWLARRLFKQVDLFAVQTAAYADSYRKLGVDPHRVVVTGSVKYDGVAGDRNNAKTLALGRLLNVRDDDLVWIAGSTQAPEEQVALDIYRRISKSHPTLRLFLVPRQRDRFDEVAALLQKSELRFVRRSQIQEPITDQRAMVLVDTIGELGSLWGLAGIAFVGGSIDGKRGGQNMIEPAAYGAAVVFGPHVWNFRDTADRLLQAEAAVQAETAAQLEQIVSRLIVNTAERRRLGIAARKLVLSQQGATERTIDCIDRLLAGRTSREKAA